MPVPTPNAGETEEDFISRCMANDTMQEYDEDQRAGICYSQWHDRAAARPIQRACLRASMQIADDDDRAVTVTCNTEAIGRDKLVLISRGIDLTHYRNNPIWLWQHNEDWPVARSEQIDVQADRLVARVKFPDAGVSARADEVLGLVRAGIINAASTGFDNPVTEPIDVANPRSGTRVLSCELLEMSFVSIPALPEALVSARTFDADSVRRLADAVRAWRVRRDVDNCSPEIRRSIVKRGLYEVGSLAWMLEELGWLKSSTEWEAEIEQDGSKVPAMLGAALQQLGAVLVAMTAEEVAELVGGVDVEPANDEETEIVTQAASPAVARYRIGVHRARASQPKPKPAPKHRSMAFHRRMAALYRTQVGA